MSSLLEEPYKGKGCAYEQGKHSSRWENCDSVAFRLGEIRRLLCIIKGCDACKWQSPHCSRHISLDP